MEEERKDNKIFNRFKLSSNNLASFKSKRSSVPLSFENRILNIEDFSEQPKINPKDIHYLLVKKVNLKDKTNKYYTAAVKNIFSDIDKFLEHKYEGKKVIVGKECTSNGLKELRDYFLRKNKRKRTLRKNDLKASLIYFNRTMKNKGSQKFSDITRNTSSDTIKNMNLFSGKEYITKYPLSDFELKKIFQESAAREKYNKKKKIDLSNSSEIYKKLDNNKNKSAKTLFSNTERMNINNMLNLQEKILKDRITKNKMNKKIVNKIMSATLKENSKLLMNNKKDLLIIKKKEIDKEESKIQLFIKKDKVLKNWVSELRINNYKEKKKLYPIKKEIIYYNKNINSSMEMNDTFNKSNMYKKINNYDILKTKRPSLFSKYNRKSKSPDNDNIDKKETLYNSLYVKGKNLLEHEMKISKELIGKKKKIIHYFYPHDEISNVLLAKSKNLNTPKAIINSIEIHNL